MGELRLTRAACRPRRRYALIRGPRSLSARPRIRPREPQRRLSQCVLLPDPLFSFLFSLTLISHVRGVWEEPFQSRF